MAGWLVNTSIREGGVMFLQEHIQSTTYIWEAKLLSGLPKFGESFLKIIATIAV